MLEKGNFINNRYEIISRVGAGGMSEVYKAKDHKLNRNVAIKVLKKEFSKDKNFVSKFRVEAQSAASLIHPNIVNVYDVGEDEGLYYIVMELIEGITLKSYIEKKKKLSARETISIAIQIANGIECAHNNQIVHRDIKPQNIMISREGKVKVTDFGIARAASSNTMSGTAMGSVHYISPEQAGGKYVDEKSDIYSLGITMFEMITGTVPFDGESTVSIALKHIQGNVPSVREYVSDVPVSLEKIILKCTRNKVDRRYPKISLLIADLKRALAEPNVDFVQLEEVKSGTVPVMITDEEIKKIKKESGEIVDPDIENDIDEDSMNPKMEKFITVGGVVAGIVALVIVAVILTWVLSDTSVKLPRGEAAQQETIDPKKSKVPNVMGRSADEAEKMLNEQNIGFEYDSNYVYSDAYPRDTVVSQSVTPGTIVDKNSTIKLTISKGAEKIQIPSGIIGSKADDGVKKLDALGLKTEISYEYSDRTIGMVISCSPGEKASVFRSDVIKLVVSRGREKSEEKVYTIPSLVGLKQSKAQAKIASSGFSVGEVREEYNDKVEKGAVIRQTVKAGGKAPQGLSIGLVVSKGSESEEKYKATYTFALEDLHDADGTPITEGVVQVTLDGNMQKIDSMYSDVSNWPGDYEINLVSNKKGKAQVELFVNGKSVKKDTVKLK